MTDCALADPVRPAGTDVRTARTRKRRPRGVPRWAWIFGVTVVPLVPADDDSRQTWVVSAGAGTTHTTALLYDEPTD